MVLAGAELVLFVFIILQQYFFVLLPLFILRELVSLRQGDLLQLCLGLELLVLLFLKLFVCLLLLCTLLLIEVEYLGVLVQREVARYRQVSRYNIDPHRLSKPPLK